MNSQNCLIRWWPAPLRRQLTLARRLYEFGVGKLVLSAGMPRSGSTLLFNIARLCLEGRHDGVLSSAWIGDARNLPRSDVYLIKTHDLPRLLCLRASTLLFSYRDVRDSLVSYEKMFKIKPSLELCRQFIAQYVIAKRHSALMLKYEDFASHLESSVVRVAEVLNISINPVHVLHRLPRVHVDLASGEAYDKRTLLHGGHGTGTPNGAWKGDLCKNLQTEIQAEFEWWFLEAGYDFA